MSKHLLGNCFLFVSDSVSRIPSCPPTFYIAEDDFEFVILLPLPLKCWDFRAMPPHPVYVVLEIEPRALCVLDKSCSVTELYPAPFHTFSWSIGHWCLSPYPVISVSSPQNPLRSCDRTSVGAGGNIKIFCAPNLTQGGRHTEVPLSHLILSLEWHTQEELKITEELSTSVLKQKQNPFFLSSCTKPALI